MHTHLREWKLDFSENKNSYRSVYYAWEILINRDEGIFPRNSCNNAHLLRVLLYVIFRFYSRFWRAFWAKSPRMTRTNSGCSPCTWPAPATPTRTTFVWTEWSVTTRLQTPHWRRKKKMWSPCECAASSYIHSSCNCQNCAMLIDRRTLISDMVQWPEIYYIEQLP